MAARRPRHRRWFVRRRRFLDAQGVRVTDTWINNPLLPRRILTQRSPDRRVWHVQISGSPVRYRVLPAVLLVVASMWDILRHVGTSQWVARIPDALMILGGLGILAVLSVQPTHRPE